MASVWDSVITILAVIVISYLLKVFKVLKKEHGETLLTKVIFYVTLPATVFFVVYNTKINYSYFLLPLAAGLIILLSFIASYLITSALKLDRKTKGAFIIGSMIMNTGMIAYPFLFFLYGIEGLARVSVFDLGNGIITLSLTYFIATAFGSKKFDVKESIKRVLMLPALWAIIIAILLNLYSIQIPNLVLKIVETFHLPTIPLLLVSLGLYLEFNLIKGKYVKILLAAIFTRIVLGLLFGLLISYLFNFKGLDRIVVLLSSITPAGFNSIIFSAKEGLNTEFAVMFVSVTAILSLLLIPLLSVLF